MLQRHQVLRTWVAPGGHVDAGETPWDAAVREAREVTGLEHVGLANGSSDFVHVDVHPGPRGHTHLDLRYLLDGDDADPAPLPDESQDVFSVHMGRGAADRRAIDDRDPHPPVEEAVNGTGGHGAAADHVNHVMTDRAAPFMTMTTGARRHTWRELLQTEGM